jgi:glycosyltransferase involved in cell wall biosynthesis
MSPVHLLNPLTDACGGSEWRTLSLFEMLADVAEVDLWTLGEPDRALYGKYPIRRPEPERGLIPRRGTFVLVGTYFPPPGWLPDAEADRVVIVHNIPLPRHVRYMIEQLQAWGMDGIEVVTASEGLREHLEGLNVAFSGSEPSWIDLSRFRTSERAVSEGPLRVGRLSRDVPEKFHTGAADLFRACAQRGCRVRIMGGTVLTSQLATDPEIELLPAGEVSAEAFLEDMDVFLYRTHDEWMEAFGRSVVEAMACGVVPVAHARGGYAEVIRHGENGALFEQDEEALEWVDRLDGDRGLLERMSRAARQTADDLYGPAARERMIRFYTSPRGAAV